MPDHHSARILLVDDHILLREGLHRSLTAQGYEVIAEAGDGQEAIELAERYRPDIVLMDVTMPVLDGIEATRRLHQSSPDLKVIILTMHADSSLIHSASVAGARGYLMKDCTTDEIVSAIDRTLAGDTTFPPGPKDVSVGQAEPRLITPREAEVLQLIADGKSTSEAARDLYVSVKTVKNHLASAYAKLDTHDRTQAVLTAARLGLITLKQ